MNKCQITCAAQPTTYCLTITHLCPPGENSVNWKKIKFFFRNWESELNEHVFIFYELHSRPHKCYDFNVLKCFLWKIFWKQVEQWLSLNKKHNGTNRQPLTSKYPSPLLVNHVYITQSPFGGNLIRISHFVFFWQFLRTMLNCWNLFEIPAKENLNSRSFDVYW